jgi:GNAT superfamily N-acetyltransferase
MFKKYRILIVVTILAIGSCVKPHDFTLELKELGNGMQSYALTTPKGTCVSSLTITPGSILTVLDSLDTIDKSEMPIEVLNLIHVIKAIKAKYNLAEVAMVGDLYVPSEYRGKGHARNLLTKVCHQIFSKGFKAVVLVPDPFEYEDGRQNLLANEVKKQQLIKLYQNCGFKKISEDKPLFMYRDAITP